MCLQSIKQACCLSGVLAQNPVSLSLSHLFTSVWLTLARLVESMKSTPSAKPTSIQRYYCQRRLITWVSMLLPAPTVGSTWKQENTTPRWANMMLPLLCQFVMKFSSFAPVITNKQTQTQTQTRWLSNRIQAGLAGWSVKKITLVSAIAVCRQQTPPTQGTFVVIVSHLTPCVNPNRMLSH